MPKKAVGTEMKETPERILDVHKPFEEKFLTEITDSVQVVDQIKKK